jgi:hypothetical protein
MFPKVLGVPPVLAYKGSRDDIGKVALGRHAGGARLSFSTPSVEDQAGSEIHRTATIRRRYSRLGRPENRFLPLPVPRQSRESRTLQYSHGRSLREFL